MQLRAAIRYSEYKASEKLPSNISFDCAECIEKELQDKRNCGGIGNPNYKIKIGGMEFYQCPISIPDENTWNVIDLIMTAEETGIPVVGTCLLDQTKKYFEWRRIINSERIDCHKELDKIRKREMEDNKNKKTIPTRRQPRSTRSHLMKKK